MNTKIKTGIGLIIIIILVTTIGVFVWKANKKIESITENIPQNSETITNNQNSAQIANPASVYCEQNGGTLEIRTGEDGEQTGYCKFADGSECEEWKYYRGECKPGDNRARANIGYYLSRIQGWGTYRNDAMGFSVDFPIEWAPIETETYRDAISGKGKEFYTLFKNSNLSISGNTADFVPWESFLTSYNGTDPLIYCRELEKSVVTLDGCKTLNKDMTAITFGHYDDMEGLILLREAYVRNQYNKYSGLKISYRFESKDEGLGNMDDRQVKNAIENKLKQIDQDRIKIFDQILSTFEFVNNENCWGGCECFDKCNSPGSSAFYEYSEGSRDCSSNKVNKICCCWARE